MVPALRTGALVRASRGTDSRGLLLNPPVGDSHGGPTREDFMPAGKTIESLNPTEVETPGFPDERMQLETCPICRPAFDRRCFGEVMDQTTRERHRPLDGAGCGSAR